VSEVIRYLYDELHYTIIALAGRDFNLKKLQRGAMRPRSLIPFLLLAKAARLKSLFEFFLAWG